MQTDFRAWNGKEMIYDVGVFEDRPIVRDECSNEIEYLYSSNGEIAFLMEYVKKRDKNGKKVFMFDIVKVLPTPNNTEFFGIVIFDNDYKYYVIKSLFSGAVYHITVDFEVVGNAYQLPELKDIEKDNLLVILKEQNIKFNSYKYSDYKKGICRKKEKYEFLKYDGTNIEEFYSKFGDFFPKLCELKKEGKSIANEKLIANDVYGQDVEVHVGYYFVVDECGSFYVKPPAHFFTYYDIINGEV